MIKGRDIRKQFGINQWLDQHRIMTLLDLAKREDILPGLRWDLVIADDAKRMSAAMNRTSACATSLASCCATQPITC